MPIVDPRFVLVGDSLQMFNNLSIGMSGVTVTRDAAGVLTVAKPSHQVNGSQPVYLANMNDASFEVLGNSTYVDANNFTIQSSVTGAAGSTTGQALGVGNIINRLSSRGIWPWLQSKLLGGGRLVGNFGQGGDRLDEMTAAVAKAAATASELVIINGGINDLNASATSATIISRMQAHVDTLVAAGKRVCIISVTPLGSSWPATEAKKLTTIAANAGYAAIAAANPASVCYADVYTPLADPTYQGAGLDGRAYSWAVYDGIHWTQKAGRFAGGAVHTAVSPWITPSTALPVNSTDLPVVAGYTAIKQYGPWTSAGGGFIPSWANCVVVPLAGVSTNGADHILFQLGSGGIKTSGYLSTAMNLAPGPSLTSGTFTAGFGVLMGGAAAVIHGEVVFTRVGSGSDTWEFTTNISRSDGAICNFGDGSATLTGALDTVRMTTVGAVNTFDGGSAAPYWSA